MNKILDWAKAHPKLSMWTVLGIGMVAIIAYEARDVGLLAGQWIALIVATILVAGLCVWIIGWEDDEDDAEGVAAATAPVPVEAAKGQKPAMAATATAGEPKSKNKKKKK
jgi:hypothetical protein